MSLTEALDKEITQTETQLEAMKSLRGLLGGTNGQAKPKKTRMPRTHKEPTTDAAEKPAGDLLNRIVAFLTRNGPANIGTLATAIGYTPTGMSIVVQRYSRFFVVEKQGNSKMVGLADEGKRLYGASDAGQKQFGDP